MELGCPGSREVFRFGQKVSKPVQPGICREVPCQEPLPHCLPNSCLHYSLGEQFAKQRCARHQYAPAASREMKRQAMHTGGLATIQQKEFSYATHHQVCPLHLVARHCHWAVAEGNCHSSS